MAGRTRGAASRAAKGAKKKKATATKYAADRRRARNGKEWKPSTKSLDTRSAELLASAEIESTAAKLILARQAVMLSDGDLFDDLMGPEPPRNNVVKTTRKRATKKKAKKKKKKVAKKKTRRRRTLDDDVDAYLD